MSGKWTPGPWPAKMTGDGKRIEIGTGLVEGPRGYDVAEVYSDDCDQDEAWANAHLISSAPDLYAALELLLPVAQAFEKQASMGSGGRRGGMAFTKARAALAKARGETK